MDYQRYLDRKRNRELNDAIGDLRNLHPSEAVNWKNQERSLDVIMESIIKSHKIGVPRPEDKIIEYWKDIIGKNYAHRCRPERITTQNQLVIVINNPILRQEIEFKKRSILMRIHHIPECKHINKLILKS